MSSSKVMAKWVVLGFALLSQAAESAIVGDVKDTKKGISEAVQCHHEAALQHLDKAIAAGGFAAELAVLEKIVVLFDAGREAEARQAMTERNQRTGASEDDIAEAESSVEETLENLRDEREKKTGSRTCP